MLKPWLLGAESHTQYLDALDVGLARAAAPIDEEDELPMCLPRVGLHRLEVRTEVEHDDRVVGNIFVETLPDDFCLEEKGTLLDWVQYNCFLLTKTCLSMGGRFLKTQEGNSASKVREVNTSYKSQEAPETYRIHQASAWDF